MRVLYFFPEHKGDFMFYWQRIHFIDELTRSGVFFEILNPLDYSSLEQAHHALLSRIHSKQYDLFFITAPLFINKEIIEEIKKVGIPTLCFRPDNLLIPFIDKETAPAFDLVWISSQETELLYKKWGVNYYFAPYAANPFQFRPTNAPRINRVCFIGTPYGSRTNMINTILNGSIDIDVFCKNVEEKRQPVTIPNYEEPTPSKIDILLNNLRFNEGRRVLWANVLNKLQKHKLQENHHCLHLFNKVPFTEISSLYSSYSLSLSSTSARNTDILKNPVKVVNLRAFEIPMCGGLQFCRFNYELSQYYEEDKEIVFYRDNHELIDKAKFYINKADDSTITRMKSAARKRSENEHTWLIRFSHAFELLGLKNKWLYRY